LNYFTINPCSFGLGLGLPEYQWFHLYIIQTQKVQIGINMRALIVDDNDQILDVLSFLLETNNVEFKTVNNGKDALELIRNKNSDNNENKFDLVFLDLAMPEMSGFDVVDNLHANGGLENIKLVVITALELAPEDEKLLYEKGVTALLKKPILVEDVEKLLEN
jgi:CheY-like chemotaxis protein